MICKILAFFILPCLVMSFKIDMEPALKGNNFSFLNAWYSIRLSGKIYEETKDPTGS